MSAALTELASLARAPFRVEIAGRDNGDQDSRLPELSDNLVGKNIIALKFLVSPDLRLAAQAHAQDGLQGRMKPRDPTLFSRAQRLIVDVGVADEEVLLEIHPPLPLTFRLSLM